MRKTYRTHKGSKAYWTQRWENVEADNGELNFEKYPGKFADVVMKRVDGRVLEAGCGAGRVVRHYSALGQSIVGMDFVEVALQKIRVAGTDATLCAANTLELPFSDDSFDGVLAFGLYHSLESGIDEALAETRRILKPGGWLCASMRADNFQNRVVDWMADRGNSSNAERHFHKANYSRQEFSRLLESTGFRVESFNYVENMPFLYKFALFRHRTHRRFNEHQARSEGYRFSAFGQVLQTALMKVRPSSFCNINVAIAQAV